MHSCRHGGYACFVQSCAYAQARAQSHKHTHKHNRCPGRYLSPAYSRSRVSSWREGRFVRMSQWDTLLGIGHSQHTRPWPWSGVCGSTRVIVYAWVWPCRAWTYVFRERACLTHWANSINALAPICNTRDPEPHAQDQRVRSLCSTATQQNARVNFVLTQYCVHLASISTGASASTWRRSTRNFWTINTSRFRGGRSARRPNPNRSLRSGEARAWAHEWVDEWMRTPAHRQAAVCSGATCIYLSKTWFLALWRATWCLAAWHNVQTHTHTWPCTNTSAHAPFNCPTHPLGGPWFRQGHGHPVPHPVQ